VIFPGISREWGIDAAFRIILRAGCRYIASIGFDSLMFLWIPMVYEALKKVRKRYSLPSFKGQLDGMLALKIINFKQTTHLIIRLSLKHRLTWHSSTAMKVLGKLMYWNWLMLPERLLIWRSVILCRVLNMKSIPRGLSINTNLLLVFVEISVQDFVEIVVV